MPADTSTAARRTAVRIEESIRRDSLETGALIDRNGQVLVRRQGTHDQIELSVAELLQAADATFTHNHPDGYGPSLEDVVVAARWQMRELRVVTRNDRYIASNLYGGLAIPLRAKFLSEESGAFRSVFDDVKRGHLNPADAGVETRDRTWRPLANQLGFQYRREP